MFILPFCTKLKVGSTKNDIKTLIHITLTLELKWLDRLQKGIVRC